MDTLPALTFLGIVRRCDLEWRNGARDGAHLRSGREALLNRGHSARRIGRRLLLLRRLRHHGHERRVDLGDEFDVSLASLALGASFALAPRVVFGTPDLQGNLQNVNNN